MFVNENIKRKTVRVKRLQSIDNWQQEETSLIDSGNIMRIYLLYESLVFFFFHLLTFTIFSLNTHGSIIVYYRILLEID